MISVKPLLKTHVKELSVFSSGSFMVLGLTFKSLTHFKLVLMGGTR